MRPLLKPTRVGLITTASVLVMSLVVAGCTDLGGTDGPDTGSETTVSDPGTAGVDDTSVDTLETTTTLPPAVTVTTVHVDASEELLPSGNIRACGIIEDVWVEGSVRKLKIDYVDFLGGPEADAAAVADGVISPGEHVDNDYYVRNNNTKLRTFTVSGSVAITTYSRDMDPGTADPPVSWTTFYNFWNLVGPPAPGDWGLSDGMWWIERSSATNEVVIIEQQWVP